MAEAGSVFVSVIPSLDGFSRKVRTELKGLDVTVSVKPDTKQADRQLGIFGRIVKTTLEDSLSASVKVDDGAARTKIGLFRAMAEGALSGLTAHVDVDTSKATAGVAEAKTGIDGLGSSILGATSKVALFGAAGAIGLGVVGAGAGFAAGALGLLAAPIAAAKLGADGLKASFGQLTPQVDTLKASVSSAFEKGMQPAVNNLRGTFPLLRTELAGTATALSVVATQVTAVVAPGKAGFEDLQGILGGVNGVLTSMAGPLSVLTGGILMFANAGISGLSGLGPMLGGFATQFTNMIGSLAQTGVIQGAVGGLVQVLGALLGIVGPLIGIGLRLFQVLGPPLAQALTILQGAIAPLGQALMALAPVVGQIAIILAQVLVVAFQALAPVITALAPLLGQVAAVVGGALIQVIQALAGPLQVVATALATSLAPVLPVIAQAFSSVVTALAPVVAILAGVFAQVLLMLAPILGMVAQTLATVLVSAIQMLAPLLPQIAAAFFAVLGAVMPLVPVLLQFVTQVIQALLPILPLLVGIFLQLVAALLPLLPPIIQLASFVLPILASIIGFLVPIIGFLANILGTVLVFAVNVVVGIITGLFWVLTNLGTIFNWLWQSVIVPVWNGISAAISFVWNSILKPIFDAIGFAIGLLATILFTVLVAPFVIAWNIISAAAQWAWKNILQPIWEGAIQPALQALGNFFTWLWQNAVVPAWNGIVAVVQWAWTNIIQPLWNDLMNGLRVVGSVFSWLWNNIVVPVWNGITAAISTAWNWVRDNVFTPIHNFVVDTLGAVFNWLWLNVISPVWEGIKTAIDRAWNFIKGIFNTLKGGVNDVGQVFQNIADWIGRAWDSIKEAARKPVQWVVDVVYNNGIRPVWNGIAGLFGMPQLGPVKLAEGGVLPGYTPGRDYIPTMLSGGEGILVPEAVRGLGAGFIGWANRTFSGGRSPGGVGTPQGGGYAKGGIARFADGGVVGGIGDFLSGAGDVLMNLFTDPVKAIKDLFANVTGDAGKTPGVGGWTDALKALPGKVIGAVVDKAKSFIASLGSTGGGGAGVDKWSGVALQALSMAGQPASMLGLLLMQMKSESGGNPGARNDWDINAQQGHASVGLMQVIPSTFNSYAGPLRGLGILNPLANIYAAIKYTLARYGSLPAGWHGHGYDQGGIASGTGFMAKQVISPERVLSPRQTASFERLVPLLTSMSRPGSSVGPGVYDGISGVAAGSGATWNIYPAAGQDEVSIGIAAARRAEFMERARG